MLFKGTRKRTTRQIKEQIEGLGGQLNAYTGEESTCYFAKVMKQNFESTFDVLADMINHATLKSRELEKERTVILEEIKMYQDLPSQFVQEKINTLLWPDQPLGRPIAGTKKTVSGMSRKDLLDYKNRHYHPSEILVAVSGELSPFWVEKLAAQSFNGSKKKVANYQKASTRQRKPQVAIWERKTEQTHFVVGLHAVSKNHSDRYLMGLLNVILGANMSSRLFEEVREKRGLAYEIRSQYCGYQDTGIFQITAGVETGKTIQAIRVILKELEKIASAPVKAKELERAKEYYWSRLQMTAEDTLDHMLWAGEYYLYRDHPPAWQEIQEKIWEATPEDVRRVAESMIKNNRLNLAAIGPLKEPVKNRIQKEFVLR